MTFLQDNDYSYALIKKARVKKIYVTYSYVTTYWRATICDFTFGNYINFVDIFTFNISF